MADRRAFLTVDLDCMRCSGHGFVEKELTIGWGPDAHHITLTQPCRCLSHEEMPEEPSHD